MKREDWNIVQAKERYSGDGEIAVECYARIKNNDTGEVRTHPTIEYFIDESCNEPNYFNWEENNYSCDCNRRLFWLRANNESDEDAWDIPCSDGKFSVNLHNSKNNKCYYSEFDE